MRGRVKDQISNMSFTYVFQMHVDRSLNKWTTLALGGLEARKHEQRVDLMSVNRW